MEGSEDGSQRGLMPALDFTVEARIAALFDLYKSALSVYHNDPMGSFVRALLADAVAQTLGVAFDQTPLVCVERGPRFPGHVLVHFVWPSSDPKAMVFDASSDPFAVKAKLLEARTRS